MSTKPRPRRNRAEKKFMEQDNENVIGVMDESVEVRNKIEEKQDDMFDPHKIKHNILQEDNLESQLQHQPGDLPQEEISKSLQTGIQPTIPHNKQQQNGSKRRRDRGKREVKKFDSDPQVPQDEKEKQKLEIKKESIFQPEEDTLQEPPEEFKEESTTVKKEESNLRESDDEEDERMQEQKMKEMASKKTPTVASNYIHMHSLMNQAGFNKEERRMAIYTPLKPQQQTFVYFKRYQSGFSECYQIIGEDQRPILFCQNQRGCIGCNYYISLTKEMDKNNPSYLGKLRGNAAGSVYQLFDHGLQPNNDYDRSKFRVSMAYVQYQSNFLGMKGPRKLKAVVPKVSEIQDFDMFKFSEQENLNEFVGSNIVGLRNKSPRWNQRLKSYALNFGGRVKQASIKNFILIEDRFSLEEQDKAPNVIVFGKIDESTFALQFGHPLSLYQAFGIAMSEFDFKLKCQ